jgi:hypothetical protein
VATADKSNKTSATTGAGTAHPSGAHKFTRFVCWFFWGFFGVLFWCVRVGQSLGFFVVFGRSLFVFLSFFFFFPFYCFSFHLSPFGIWKPFCEMLIHAHLQIVNNIQMKFHKL